MTAKATFLGLRTVVYYVVDLNTAKTWYASALGIEPYFDTEYYVGFNVGGYELGLHPGQPATPNVEPGSVVYWGVEKIDQELKRLIELGATLRSEIQEVGGDIKVADVKDPFGNILGLIENPHFPNTAEPGIT